MFRLTLIVTIFAVCYARNPLHDATDAAFNNECLAKTNAYRAHHGAAPLKISQKNVDYAKSRCQSRSRSEGLSAGHTGLDKAYGENLYWGASGGSAQCAPQSCGPAIDNWYAEKKNYRGDWQSNPPVGHFTALVWKGTTEVGCARCYGKPGDWCETYVVCNYTPPGNMLGEFKQNVQA